MINNEKETLRPANKNMPEHSLCKPETELSHFYKACILFGVIGALLGAISRLTVVDLDIFHEMALFRAFVSTHSFPKGDIFSYVPVLNPTVHHEWGFGALLYFVTVFSKLGATGLLLLKYLLCASVCYGTYAFARRHRTSVYIFAPMSIVAIGLGWVGFTTIRAQVFSLFLLIILLHLLERDRTGKRLWIAVWLPLFLVWLNVHAGFLLGVGLMIFYTLEVFGVELIRSKSFPGALRQVRHLIAVLVAMCFLLVVNPWGFEYIPYLWRAVTLDRSNLISEWSPLWHHGLPILMLFFVSLVLLVYCLLRGKCKNFSLLTFLCVTALLTLWHFRYLSIYSLAWICFIPVHLMNTSIGRSLTSLGAKRNPLYIGVWLLIGIAGSLFAVSNNFWELRIPTTAIEHEREGVPVYPVGAVRFLKDRQFRGNIMTPFGAGSYVSWKLYPTVKVSMDSRFEVAYPLSIVLENVKFYQGKENWERFLPVHTDAVLLPTWSPVAKQVGDTITSKKSIIFKKVYTDDAYSVFVRCSQSINIGLVDRRNKPISGIFP